MTVGLRSLLKSRWLVTPIDRPELTTYFSGDQLVIKRES